MFTMAMKRLLVAAVVVALTVIGLREYDDLVANYCAGHQTA